MQIRTIQKGFKAFPSANSNHSNEIRSIRIQIRTTWKRFEAFECKFKPFERDSKHLDANSNHSKGHSNPNSNHSKGIRSVWIPNSNNLKRFRSIRIPIRIIRMLIQPTRKRSEAFEFKFEPFERDLKHSSPNSKHSKGIWSTRMQILTIRKGFEAFESKFEPLERTFEAFEGGLKLSNANSNQ